MNEPQVDDAQATQVPQVEDTEFFGSLERLLDKLVPPSSLEIQTFDGTSYTLPGALPARRQVVVFRLIRELTDLDAVSSALLGMQGNLQQSNVVDLILGLCTSDEVVGKLGAIFSSAYPDVAAETGDPLDAFALEELVSSLVPFSERFIKRMGGGVALLARTASEIS